MYARLVRFALSPGNDDVGQAIADELTPVIQAQPGCQSVTVFGDMTDGEHGIFVLWDSHEHANAAAQVIRPTLDRHLAGNVRQAPDTRLFEVLS